VEPSLPDNAQALSDAYEGAQLSIGEKVERPSYSSAMSLLRRSEGRCLLLDLWARGNYVRRLLFNRSDGIRPLLVRVKTIEEVRWAHRRLALLGLPVEFLWCGELSPLGKVLHVGQRRADDVWDAGWGYVFTLWKDKRKQFWAMVIGQARLMPEGLIDWLVIEADDEFVSGNVFITPADLVGIDSNGNVAEVSTLATLSGGVPVLAENSIAEASFEIDLPYLDNMTPAKFRKFVKNLGTELVRFRQGFNKIVTLRAGNDSEASGWVDELRAEIAELTLSEKYHRLRKTIITLGGVIGTFTATVGVAAGSSPSSVPVVAAGAGAAGAALVGLWTQANEHARSVSLNPYSILWKLGASNSQKTTNRSRVKIYRPQVAAGLENVHVVMAHHWLCPPTTGIRALVVDK
jgi:hypothetical protein